MSKLFSLIAAVAALCVPAVAAANPAPWTDKNKADATVCSTYGRDGTQAVVTPQPGVNSSCVKPGNGDKDVPTGSISTPADGSTYTVGQDVPASFSCSDLQGVASCQAVQCAVVGGVVDLGSCIDVENGGALDTSTAGDYVFGVKATDTSGNWSVTSTHFTVSADGNGGNGSGSGDGSGDGSGSGSGSGSGAGAGSGSGSGNGSGDTTGSAADTTVQDTGSQLVLGARLAGCNVVLKVSHKQRSLRKKGLVLKIRSDRNCTVKMSGRLIPAKHAASRKAKARTRVVTLKLKAGKTKAVTLHFTKRGLAYLKRSLKGNVTRARIFVTDGADVGHKLNRSFTIRIKR